MEFADLLGRRESIHVGHVDIHEHNIWPQVGVCRQDLGAIGTFPHSAGGIEHYAPQQAANSGVIVND